VPQRAEEFLVVSQPMRIAKRSSWRYPGELYRPVDCGPSWRAIGTKDAPPQIVSCLGATHGDEVRASSVEISLYPPFPRMNRTSRASGVIPSYKRAHTQRVFLDALSKVGAV
jgi:hypothetical protein